MTSDASREQQRMAALRHGNEVRSARATLKREIREEVISVEALAALLRQREYPGWLEPMKVREVLESIPRLGEKRVGRLLREGRCNSSTTFVGMNRAQRGELSDALLRRQERVVQRRITDAIRAARDG